MSRFIEKDANRKTVKVTIDSMDECKWLYNEVCCNDRCDQRAEFVSTEYCKKCPQFQKEDGIIADK